MSRLEFEGRVEIVGSEQDQLILVGEGSGIHLQNPQNSRKSYERD